MIEHFLTILDYGAKKIKRIKKKTKQISFQSILLNGSFNVIFLLLRKQLRVHVVFTYNN